MTLLESFTIDHKKMPAPAIRIAKTLKTSKGDDIIVYDLRRTKPNKNQIDEKSIHTIEHLFAGFMREHLSKYIIIDISPMGCRTGFYMSVIGSPLIKDVISSWEESMKDILKVENIPEANEYQCGSYKMHSLEGAKEWAQKILDKGIIEMDVDNLKLKL